MREWFKLAKKEGTGASWTASRLSASTTSKWHQVWRLTDATVMNYNIEILRIVDPLLLGPFVLDDVEPVPTWPGSNFSIKVNRTVDFVTTLQQNLHRVYFFFQNNSIVSSYCRNPVAVITVPSFKVLLHIIEHFYHSKTSNFAYGHQITCGEFKVPAKVSFLRTVTR